MRFVLGTLLLTLIPLCAQPRLGTLNYEISWRLIRAGTVVIQPGQPESHVKIDSAGLVSALFKVDDTYSVHADDRHCTQSTSLDAKEGRRHRQTEIKYEQGKGRYREFDVLKNSTRTSEIDVPPCIHDVVSAITRLRAMRIELGQSATLPISDGKKAAQVKIEAQAREDVATPAGTFHAIRYEAFLLSGVVYQRSGKVFVWLTDDDRRVPVQFRLRMAFPVGTVNLALEKEPTP